MTRADQLSLADFFLGDSSDPAVPPPEFRGWRADAAWAMAMYEPALHGAPGPRVVVDRGGHTRPAINLSSYNYLGMAHHPRVVEAAREALHVYGTGACGSPILSGLTDLHRRLEAELAAFLGREAVMLFNSGFGGAVGAVSGMLRRGDVAVLDSRVHLCAIDGATLSRAQKVFFDHDDPGSLDEVLTRTEGKRRLVFLEGIYSMDGDVADLPGLLAVTEKHGVSVFLDEAHSILTLGEHGRGAVELHGVEGRVAVQFATFSKAFAGVGGYLAGSRDLVDYLRFYANPYGFSCALPPSVVAGVLEVLAIVQEDPSILRTLWENTAYLRSRLADLGLDLGASTSQVIPIVVGADRQVLYRACRAMGEAGLFLAPVDYPSVPEDGLRFRVAVTAAHARADLDEAVDIIAATLVPMLAEAS